MADTKDSNDSADARGPVDKSQLDPESLQYRVLTELENGRKIQAIKLLREELGIGLKEAKEAAEKIAAEYNIQAAKSGCVLVMFGLFSLATAGTLVWLC